MKKILIAVGGLIVLAAAAIFIAPSFIDWNKYKPEIAEAVKSATGRNLAIDGNLSFSILPAPNLQVAGVRVSNLPGAASPEMMSVREMRVRVSLARLFDGEFVAEQVILVEPFIRLEILPDGRRNWDVAMPSDGVNTTASTPDAPKNGKRFSVTFDKVLIQNGRITYQDGIGEVKRADAVNADISADSLTGPFSVNASAIVLGHGITAAVTTGRVENGKPTSVNATLALSAAKSEASFAGQIDLAGMSLEGKLKLDSPDARALAAVWVPDSIPYYVSNPLLLEARVSASPSNAAFNDVNVRFGGMTLNGAVTALFEKNATVDVVLNAGKIDLDGLLASAKSDKPAASSLENNTNAKGTEKTSPTEAKTTFALPKNLNVSVDFSADLVQYNGEIIRQAGIRTALSGGGITIERLSALLPGGSEVSVTGFVQAENNQPKFEGSVSAATDNLRALMDWMGVRLQGIPADRLRGFSFVSKISATPAAVQATDINIRFDASTMTGALAVAIRDRLGFGLRLAVDHFNLDAYTPNALPTAGSNNESADKQSKLTAASKPSQGNSPLAVFNKFDANVDVRVKRLTALNAQIQDLAFNGSLVGGVLQIDQFSAADLAGSKASIKGYLRDFVEEPLVSLAYEISAENPKQALRQLGIEGPEFLSAIGKSSLNGQVDGDIKKLTLRANLAAAAASVSALGTVENLSVGPKVAFDVSAAHPNAVEFVRMFAPTFTPAASNLGGASVSFSVNGDPSQQNFEKVQVAFGPARAEGNFSVDLKLEKPKIKADLAANEVLLDLFLPANQNNSNSKRYGNGAAIGSATVSRSEPVKGRWDAKPMDLSGLDLIDADIALKMAGLIFGNVTLGQPSLKVQLQGGKLDVRDFSASFFGGRLGGVAQLDKSGPQPNWSLGVAGQSINSLAMLRAFGVEDRVSGPVDLTFAGQTTGQSEAALINGLNGKGRVDGNVKLITTENETAAANALGIASALFGKKVKELGQVGSLTNMLFQAFGRSPATLSGDYTVENGVARTANLTLAGNGATAAIQGAADLPNWSVNARVGVLRAGETAPLVTADVAGPLDEPNVKIGGSFLQNRTTTQSPANPLQQILPGLLGGNKPQGTTAPTAQPKKPDAKDVLRGLIQGLGR